MKGIIITVLLLFGVFRALPLAAQDKPGNVPEKVIEQYKKDEIPKASPKTLKKIFKQRKALDEPGIDTSRVPESAMLLRLYSKQQRKKLHPLTMLYLNGRFRPGDDDSSYRFLTAITTKDTSFHTLYTAIVSEVLFYVDGALGETIGEYVTRLFYYRPVQTLSFLSKNLNEGGNLWIRFCQYPAFDLFNDSSRKLYPNGAEKKGYSLQELDNHVHQAIRNEAQPIKDMWKLVLARIYTESKNYEREQHTN